MIWGVYVHCALFSCLARSLSLSILSISHANCQIMIAQVNAMLRTQQWSQRNHSDSQHKQTNKRINMFLDDLNLKKRSQISLHLYIGTKKWNAHKRTRLIDTRWAVKWNGLCEREREEEWILFGVLVSCKYRLILDQEKWEWANTPTNKKKTQREREGERKIPDEQSKALAKQWFDTWMSAMSLPK